MQASPLDHDPGMSSDSTDSSAGSDSQSSPKRQKLPHHDPGQQSSEGDQGTPFTPSQQIIPQVSAAQPEKKRVSPTSVTVRDGKRSIAAMPPASNELGTTLVVPAMSPAVLLTWLAKTGAAAFMQRLPAGLLECLSALPGSSFREKEFNNLDSLLRTLGIHRACFNANTIALPDIWVDKVPMSEDAKTVEIRLPKGGFNQRQAAPQYGQVLVHLSCSPND